VNIYKKKLYIILSIFEILVSLKKKWLNNLVVHFQTLAIKVDNLKTVTSVNTKYSYVHDLRFWSIFWTI